MKPRYTTIQHDVRLKLGLTFAEYCLLDSIDKLSNRPEFPWCEVTRPRLAEFIGVDTRTIQRAVKRFLDEGFLEMDQKSQCVRTTIKWHELVNVNGDKMSPGGVTKCRDRGDKMSPLYIYNNINKNTVSDETLSSEEEEGTDSEIPQTFEEYMEQMGVRRESLVDSEGHVSVWWEGDMGRLSKKDEKHHQEAYKRLQRVSGGQPQPAKPTNQDTERFIELIKQVLERHHGTAPVIGAETKMLIRKNLVEKFPKEFVKAYAQWYFVDSDIEKKWRYNLRAFTSENFINQYLAQK